MAKTIKLIFVRSSGIGNVLEGKDLEDFDLLYNRAIDAYKQKMGIIDNFGTKMIKCTITPVKVESLSPEELKAPFDQIIKVQDNSFVIQLKGAAFKNYQQQLLQGLAILGLKPQGFPKNLVRIQT